MAAKKKVPPKKPVARKKKAVSRPEVAPEAFEPEPIGPADIYPASVQIAVTYRKQHGDGQRHRLGCPDFPTNDFSERLEPPVTPLCPRCPTA